jgi:hypothetical protein
MFEVENKHRYLIVTDKFEVLNGIIGLMRDVICLLLRKMYWLEDQNIRNV